MRFLKMADFTGSMKSMTAVEKCTVLIMKEIFTAVFRTFIFCVHLFL